MIFARKINRISDFYMIFARKMPEFYIIIARKIFFPNFWGHVPPCPSPVSYTYGCCYMLLLLLLGLFIIIINIMMR